MPYCCIDCNNRENFHRDNQGREYFTEREYIDKHGEVTDWGDRDTNDSEIDEMGDIKCSNCNEDALFFDTEEDMERAFEEEEARVTPPTLKSLMGEEDE